MMADSSLITKYSDIRKAIAHYLGFGLDSEEWSSDEIEIIAMILKRGLRQFYFPPQVYPNDPPHEWSFLKPVTTIETVATYSTGTVEVSSGTCTLTDGVWPSWVVTHGTLTIDTTEYTVVSRDSDTELTVSGDDVDAGTEYSLTHNGNYDLPDNFGAIEGNITFEPSENKNDILIVGEGKIRSLRRDTSRSIPQYAAVRPKTSDGSTGQRFEIMFYPIPNDAYLLSYKMLVLADTLESDQYAYGSAVHSETIEASCLAIAELQEDETGYGPKQRYFKERLAASIANDKRYNQAEYFGYNGDNSDNRGTSNERHSRSSLVTYNGNT